LGEGPLGGRQRNLKVQPQPTNSSKDGSRGCGLRLAHFSPWVDQLGDAVLSHFPASTGRADIDDLAEDGPRLVAATHHLTTRLFQEFGYAEPAQTSGDGRVRLAGWATWRTEYMVWAKECGIPVDAAAGE